MTTPTDSNNELTTDTNHSSFKLSISYTFIMKMCWI